MFTVWFDDRDHNRDHYEIFSWVNKIWGYDGWDQDWINMDRVYYPANKFAHGSWDEGLLVTRFIAFWYYFLFFWISSILYPMSM
jgi:hypothetical protein